MITATFSSLSFLLKGICEVPDEIDCRISSITLDSRDVKPGCLFVALKGSLQHGLEFANKALEQGAEAIIWEADNTRVPQNNFSVPAFEINNIREFLGLIADRFYDSPSHSLNVIGITGTDGKTSVSHFAAQAIKNCGVMGTLGIGKLDNIQKATHTTPDVFHVHQNLAEMKQQDLSAVAMEVSSHALDQARVANVQFDIAVLTNLSRDHLDYHLTLEAYAEAKQKLFCMPGLKAVVLNLDDAFGRKIYEQMIHVDKQNLKVMGYGVGEVSNYPVGSLVASNSQFTQGGIEAQIYFSGENGIQQALLKAGVLGRFNLSNLLATLASMLGLGIGLDEAIQRLSKVRTVAGRMDKITATDFTRNVLTVVDYAHTPNALETVLKALREHLGENSQQHQLICVFGCGGDRDSGKRPLMAAIAEQLADIVIVTDDNPRTENPEEIMADIVQGFEQPQKAIIEHDRAKAIRLALHTARPGDAVLIAGKGHENVQILAAGSIPFSDHEVANRILEEMAA